MFTEESHKVSKIISERSHAVVIGASMTGLLASRVLLEHFDRVTIIERDRFPSQPEARPGVPQGNHTHALQLQGQRIIEQFFPGIQAELAAAGTPSVDWYSEFYFLSLWGWGACSPSKTRSHVCSRIFLEWLIRQRLYGYKNLEFITGTQVKGLLTDESNSQIIGVKISSQETSEEQQLTADFVVDASGRNSFLPKYLEQIGYQPPTQTLINSFGGYSTCWFEIPEGFQADWKIAVVTPKAPDDKRGGFIFPVEGNRWSVTAYGVAKDYPPTNQDDFMEFFRSLRSPIIYEAIKNAKPISPVYGYRNIQNSWYHYEKLSRFPEGLIVLGDAVCAFNPFYGQGMNVAAQSALVLDSCLREQFQRSPHNLTGLTRRFQKQLAKLVKTPWSMATGEDSRWETTEGRQMDLFSNFMRGYMDRILLLSVKDANIYKIFLEVVHMLKTPQSLFAPKILAKVIMNSFGFSSISQPTKYSPSDINGLYKDTSQILTELR